MRSNHILRSALVGAFFFFIVSCHPAKAGTWVLDHFNLTGGSGYYDMYEGGYVSFGWPATSSPEPSPNGSNNCWTGGYDAWECGYSDISGTVQAVYLWQPTNGDTPVGSIPQFLVNAEADADNERCWGDDEFEQTPTANDGFGDVINDEWMASSIGSHLVTASVTSDGTSYWATLPSQSVSAHGGGRGQDISTYLSMCYTPDTRWVSIGSSLGQTYHKDAATGARDANVAANGVLTDDTIVNQPITTTVIGVDGPVTSTYTPTIQVNGSYGGDWGLLSSYHWNESIEGQNSSGVFNPLGIGSFAAPTDTSLVEKKDHIFLSAYDSSDGAEATANYYINFHEPIENWVKTGSVNYPGNNTPITNPSEWTYVCTDSNDSASANSYASATTSKTITQSYSATIGLSSTLTAEEITQIQSSEGVTVGNSVTFTISSTQQFSGAPWSSIDFYVAPSYTLDRGTTDLYGADGFDGNEPWSVVTNVSGVLSKAEVQTITFPPK